jgi:hypothetical protein
LWPHWHGILAGCQQGPRFHCSGIWSKDCRCNEIGREDGTAGKGALSMAGPWVPGVNTNHPGQLIIDWKKRHGSCEEKKIEGKKEKSPGKDKRGPGHPGRNGLGLLTCQLVSGRPEICIRNMVRRGRGTAGRSCGPGKFSLRRGPRANCTVSRSPLKSLPSVASL